MTPSEVVKAIPTWAKVAAIAGGLLGLGMVVRDWADLPAQVEVHGQAIGRNTEAVRQLARGDSAVLAELRAMRADFRRTNCVLAALGDGVPMAGAVRECGL